MKKDYAISILMLLFAFSYSEVTFSQYIKRAKPQYEWQAAWGTTAFFGDIGGKSKNGANIKGIDGTDFSTVQPAYHLGFKRNFKGRLALRSNLLFSKVEGMDFNAADPSRRVRNLSFSTPIIEANVMAELSVINFLKNSRKRKVFEYYVFGGLGGTYFNPHAEYLGKWVELRPLGTEGQGLIEGTKLYKPFTFVIPAGGGLRFNCSRNVMIFGEICYHQTFTDYLDDVSDSYYDYAALAAARGELAANLSYRGKDGEYPAFGGRGNPKSNDGYVTLVLGISNRFGKGSTMAVPHYIPVNDGMPQF